MPVFSRLCAPVLLLLAAAHAAPSAQSLRDGMIAYTYQMTLHEAGNLPLAADSKLVENGFPTDRSKGAWARVTKIRTLDIFPDPITDQVVAYGAADTTTGLTSLFVRLKYVDGKITEQEILSRGGEPGFKQDFSGLLEPDILYDAPVPAARALPRDQLIGVVQKYLDGIGNHDPSQVPFSYRCDRYSAGSKFTNNPQNPPERGGGTCGGSISHLKGQSPANRRFVVADPALGVVAAMFIIPHAERTPQGSTHVGEIFKVVDGKIRSIEEFSFVGGFPPDSGFPDQ